MSTTTVAALNGLLLAIGVLLAGSMLLFAIVSIREGEPRAFRRAILAAFLLPLPYVLAGILGLTTDSIAPASVLLAISIVLFLMLLLPFGNHFPEGDDTPSTRFDERDVMFSRRNLKPGSERFEEYYRDKPNIKELDDNFRKRPGLMEPGALYHDPISAASANASFDTVAAFHSILDRDKGGSRHVRLDRDEISRFIKQWSLQLGAVSSGIAELKDYHLYSHIGRGDRYGEPVTLAHDFAIVITVEMDKSSVDSAPYGPELMETAQQYLNSGAIAVQIAEFIRYLGCSARAHIDGSYRVICPLVARDAGLGEIGRMGLLMTPELGPRVRLAVVTTDMPLVADGRKRDLSMIDFCEKCLKCADVCPSNSIPTGGREMIDGALRWKINAESCFTYWCTIGTDCGLCMRSCPYSHPDNTMHNIVRAGLKRSALSRRLALVLDDFFYGRIPARAPIPSWMAIEVSDTRES